MDKESTKNILPTIHFTTMILVVNSALSMIHLYHRFSTRIGKEFHKEVKINSGKRIWESDINPVFRCLEENYLGQKSPKLQTAFFDIEVDFDPVRGFSRPEDPFNPITAVSVYLDWLDKLVTMVIPPKSMSWETAEEIC
jgi:hypothetical protein